ncbi:TetR/AcrR family transcriptional regulator [Amycolatopsis jejuensis]|uniref:TetR/AcrR family transcriptional regulator n=1 Tax=Amycolatopsis jejuensis TaxID=330084 RepID=UPI00068C1BF6|nr:TetR/AcrR family transcriptional regulator [Amycolatopsis jejuensis]
MPAARTESLSARHVAETRAALIRVGREMFSTIGYQAASTDEVVAGAGVSKGAMYHHFKSKRELFEAVLIEVLSEYGERLAKPKITGTDEWDRFVKLALRYVEAASTDEAFRQIILIDGPAVLGWARWREIQRDISLVGVTEAIGRYMDAELIKRMSPAAVEHGIIAALSESVMYVAHAKDRKAARKEMTAVVTTMINAFRADRP